MSTITITFGERAENSRGMQKIGTASNKGFSRDELIKAKTLFENYGYKCQIVDLNPFIEEEA